MLVSHGLESITAISQHLSASASLIATRLEVNKEEILYNYKIRMYWDSTGWKLRVSTGFIFNSSSS